MKIKLDIDTNTFVRFGLVVVGFVAVALFAYKVRSSLMVIAISAFLALALNPSVSFVAKHLPSRSRIVATTISYLLVVTALTGFTFLVVPPVIEQSSKFAQSVPGLIDEIANQRYIVDSFVEQYGLQQEVDNAIDDAKNRAASIAANLGSFLVEGAGAVFSGAATLLFVLVLSFLMLIEGPRWLQRIWGLYRDPARLAEHQALAQRSYRVITGFVNGQMLVALIASTSTLVTILILSAIFPLPANLAIPLSALIFVTGLIPMVGATIGALLVTLVLLLNSFPAAIIFLIYFVIYQQIENNFIAPVVQSKTVELSALTVLIAILVGVSFFGLIGGLISIPIAGILRVLTLHYLEKNRKHRVSSKIKQTAAASSKADTKQK